MSSAGHIIKWKQHHTNLLKEYNNKLFTDVTICCGNQKFEV